jgi:hypothetical protein
MIRARSRSVLLAAAAASAALALASCETPPEAPATVAAAPELPPAPPVAVSPRVVELAGAFETYMDRAAGVTPSFVDGASVHRSLEIAAAVEPRQLASGAVAYAAIAALQDPAFVASVRKFARDPAQRQAVAANLIRDPAYAVGIENSASAAGLIAAALEGHGARVLTAGKAVKQSAYDVQRQSWSTKTIPARDARLAKVKQLGASLVPADSPTLTRLRSLAVGEAPTTLAGASMQPPYTPVAVRGLAVAALSALGLGDDPAYAEAFAGLLKEPSSGSCLNMSKLNLNQCLAVAKPWYEDVFCLGQHIMIDTGQCVVDAAKARPVVVARTSVPVTAATAEAAAAPAGDTTAVPAAKPKGKARSGGASSSPAYSVVGPRAPTP